MDAASTIEALASAEWTRPQLFGEDKLDFRNGLDEANVVDWLNRESADVLACVDLDELWGRPICGTALADEIATERLETRLAKGEPWRRGAVKRLLRSTIVHSEKPIGFVSMVIVQRPESDLSGQCRICYEGAGDLDLVQGCGCRGSMKHIHGACLVLQWKAQGRPSSMACSLCRQPFSGSAANALAKAYQLDVDSRCNNSVTVSERRKLLRTKVSIATTTWQEGRLREAAKIFRETIAELDALDLAEDMDVLTAHHNLGLVLQDQGDLDGAAHHIGLAGRGFSRMYGEDHPFALKALHNEALLLQKRGHFAQAEIGYAHVLERRREKLGRRHVDTLKTACNMGLLLHHMRRYEAAADTLRDTLQGLEQVVGQDHPLSMVTKQNLSLALSALEPKSEDAVRLGREAAEGRLQLLGPDNAEVYEGWRDFALVLDNAGEHEEAERIWRQALSGQERLLGFAHATTQQTLRQLQDALKRLGDIESAERLKREADMSIAVNAAPLKAPSMPGPLVAVLLGLFLLEEFRARGFGQAVVENCCVTARALGATAFEAWVPASAERPLCFLTKAGFARVAERTLVGCAFSPIVHLHLALQN